MKDTNKKINEMLICTKETNIILPMHPLTRHCIPAVIPLLFCRQIDAQAQNIN